MNPALMYSAMRLNGRRTGAAPAPSPDPVPDGLTLQMTAEYVDTSGDLQTDTANNTTTPTITGVAPFTVRFDGRGSRSTDVNCDDENGAVTRMGWRYDFGGAASGTWSLTGHSKNQVDNVPFTTFVFEIPGTYSVRQYSGDTEDRQGYITTTVVVSAPAAGTDISVGGSWPTFVSGGVYNLAAGTDHSGKGTLNLNGLHNVLIRKTGSGADPIVTRVNWDTRGVESSAVSRTRNCRIDGINAAVIGESAIGPLYCTVLNHSGSFSYSRATPWGDWLAATTNTQRDNIAYPRGSTFWNCNEITSAGDNYVFIWEAKNVCFRNTTLNKTSGDTGQHIFRGGYDGLDMGASLLRSSVPTMSYMKLTGWENGSTFDAWDANDRFGPSGGGSRYQPVGRMNIIWGCIFGDSTSTAHSGILIEVMPENDEAGSPDQASELTIIRDNVCYEADLGLRYIGVGGRNIAYSNNLMDMGAGDPIQVGTGLRTNRIPSGWDGPYISTTPPAIA